MVYSVVSATTTTLTLDVSAPTADGALTGKMLQVLEGTFASSTGSKYISAYNGATKTATVSAAFASAVAAGVRVQVGYNDNAVGFSWGAERVRLRKMVFRGYPMSKMTPAGLGGKALNFEQGIKDAVVEACTFEDCYTGLYLNAHPGNARDQPTGYTRWVQAIRASDLHFERCGSMISAGILDGAAGILVDADRLQATLTNLTYRNCGHAPGRIVGTQRLCCAIRIEAGLVPFPDIFSACGPSRASRVM